MAALTELWLGRLVSSFVVFFSLAGSGCTKCSVKSFLTGKSLAMEMYTLSASKKECDLLLWFREALSLMPLLRLPLFLPCVWAWIPLDQGTRRRCNFLLEPFVPGKMQDAGALSFQSVQASKSLLVLDDFSDPVIVNKFGSLLLSLIVCV